MAETVRNVATRFEPSDVPLSLVARLAMGLAAALVIAPLIVLAIFPSARRDQPQGPIETYAAPRLQVDPAAELAAHRAAEAQRLSSYGWADRTSGRVRIPIEEAMKRIAAAGIPDWPEPGK